MTITSSNTVKLTYSNYFLFPPEPQGQLTPLLMGDAGGKKYVLLTKLRDDKKLTQCRGETVVLIGGGRDYSYIRVLPDSIRISFEMNLKTTA